MLIVAIAVVCLLLLMLAFLLPRFSRHPERGVKGALGMGSQAGSKAPGPLGRLFRKPFDSSQKAVGKSARAGRRGRGKTPV